ncbi:MAG: methyl-accepting chemotaxis protein [Candidatus Zixiibacteriota bacterium]
MFKWNIRNQILSTGILGFLVVVVAIASFYRFSREQFIGSTQNLISLSDRQYSNSLGDIFQKQSAAFESWISDDVYGLAIEFETTKELQAEFVQRLKSNEGFAVLALTDKSGNIIEIAGNEAYNSKVLSLKGRHLSDIASVPNMAENSVDFIDSDILKSNNGGTAHAYLFYHPAKSMDGNVIGAFVAYTDWSRTEKELAMCTENLAKIGLRGAKVLFVFPQTGNVPLQLASDGIELVQSRTTALAHWSATAINNSVVETEAGDITMLAGASKITPPSIGTSKEAKTPMLVTAIDLDAVTSSLNGLVLKIIILACLGTFIALGASYIVARKISRRIALIGGVAEELAQGNIEHDIEISSKDEIGQLIESFKNMIDYMKHLARAAEDIARNDLTIKVEPRSEADALGNAFKTMVANLTGIVGDIAKNAAQLVTAATEITSSAEEMAHGANSQTEQAAQISTAIEEMAATILQASKNANEAREIAEGASAMAAEGQSVVGDTIHGMIRIADSASDSGRIVNELATASDRIGEIIGVIDDIADQTNLLALNAAIEAARAGEQGRGFAVVADEVRKLAERTGKATGEITEMIKGIQNDSSRAVQSMEQAGKLVEEGKSKADRAGSSLNEINTMSSRVMEMIVQIAAASDEQSSAAEQISRNMEQIANVSRQAADGAKESASAAENLNQQAESLQAIVDRFRLVN